MNLVDGELRCYDRSTFEQHRARGGLISGQQTRHYIIDTAQLAQMISVRLHPAGLWRLFGIPAGEITDAHIPASELLGSRWNNLADQVHEARTLVERVRVVEGFLMAGNRRPSHPAVEYAIHRIKKQRGAVRVMGLAEEYGLSFRRFNELFVREVGVSSKKFARLCRFQAVFSALQRASEAHLSRVAADHDYTDQAHLTRDFAEFTGLTPAHYRTHKRGLS